MPKQILIIDDNPDDSYFLVKLLQKHRVANPSLVLSDGLVALDYLAGKAPYSERALYPFPALIFLDLHLPGANGHDILRWFRAHPQVKKPPVIVHTQTILWADLKICRELGADGFLLKQTREDQLPFIVADFAGVWEFSYPLNKANRKCA